MPAAAESRRQRPRQWQELPPRVTSWATVRRANGSRRPAPGRRPAWRRAANNGIGCRRTAPPLTPRLRVASSPRQRCAIILWIVHHEAGLTARGIGFDARLIGALGIGRYISGLLPQLARLLGDRLTVVANREDAAIVRALIGGSSHLMTVNARPYRLAEQSLLPLSLIRADLALIHFPHYNLPLIKPGHFVVTVHDLFPFQFPEIHSGALPRGVNQMLMRNAVRRAERIITPSRATALAVEQSFPRSADRVLSIPEAADDRFTSRRNPEAEAAWQIRPGIRPPYVFYLGQWK